jgi:hypothetical protein
MGKVMSEDTKPKLANDLGFGDRTADGDWSDVTTGEVGSMVREAINAESRRYLRKLGRMEKPIRMQNKLRTPKAYTRLPGSYY